MRMMKIFLFLFSFVSISIISLASDLRTAPTDTSLITSDVVINDVSTTKHGFAPKSPNDATKYLDGTGSYTIPVGSAGTSLVFDFTVTGSAATSISTSGTTTLDGSTQKGYLFELTFSSAASNVVRIYFNNDTTNTDYYNYQFTAGAATNDAYVYPSTATSGFNFLVTGEIVQDANGIVTLIARGIMRANVGNTINNAFNFATWKITAVSGTPANLTRIDIVAGSANQLAVGSRLRLWSRK